MNNKPSSKERLHLARVKELSCALCDAPGPSQAHHIVQHYQYTTIPLCPDCHGSWHGTKALWRVRKMDPMMALNETVKKLCNGS